MKKIAIGFTVLVAAVIGYVVRNAWPPSDVVAFGTFVVLSLTLIAVIWYGYDTNAIARVTRERWERDGVLSTTYEMVLTPDAQIGDAGRTLVRLHNPSRLVVRARFTGNFRVYGHAVTPGDMYDGQERWLLFPQQVSQGWFEIERLLQQQGKNVAAMRAECTEANRETQLTMMLELEFQDELGALRTLPPRRHYFDFERWAWIPQLGERG